MEHYLEKLDYTDPKTKAVATGGRHFFLIWMDFDTIEANGVVSSIRARLTCGEERDGHLCPVAIMSDQKWDHVAHRRTRTGMRAALSHRVPIP